MPTEQELFEEMARMIDEGDLVIAGYDENGDALYTLPELLKEED